MGELVVEKAKKLELEGFLKHTISPTYLTELNIIFNDVYAVLRPKPIEYHHRGELIRIFNQIAKEIYGNGRDSPVVEGFGSYIMDMFSAGSDLDLSVNFNSNTVEIPRQKKIQILRKFAKKLNVLQRRGHVEGIQTIMTARVPIVKVTDCGTRIECDISVENRDGILKSQIINVISAIDERFHMLSFLMKAWAKANGVNSSKDRTLNSLSIVSLVACHLQTRDPPILPPFSALFKDGTDPPIIRKVVNNYLSYGEKNKESVAELFITLLVKLKSVEKLWSEGLCASLYEGCWISKTWSSDFACISVEDFTVRFQNFARAVGKEGFETIYDSIHLSINHLFTFLEGKMQGSQLCELMFGTDTLSRLEERVKNLVKLPTTHYDNPLKKIRLSEASEEKQLVKRWGGNQQLESPGPKQKVARWGGTEQNDGWGCNQQVQSSGPVKKVARWGRAGQSGGWEGNQQVESLGPMQKVARWGGTEQSDGWGGNQQVENLGLMHKVARWGGTEQRDGWEKEHQAHGHALSNPGAHFTLSLPHQRHLHASSVDNKFNCGPPALPSICNQNQTGFKRAWDSTLPQQFVSPQYPSHPYTSQGTNPIVAIPFLEPIHLQLPHTNHNPHLVSRVHPNINKIG